jgi:hypothetical protein
MAYGSSSKYALNFVSNKFNIPSIELQHGIMSCDAIAYNFSKLHKTLVTPDYLFLFGDFWKNFSNNFTPDKNLISIGYLHFEKKLSLYKKSISKKINSKKVFLFISQHTIGKELSKLAIQLSQNSNNKYKVIYKLHPSEFLNWEIHYPNFKNTNIEVICNNKQDIYYYFSIADYQVGVYSLALFEGIAFNLKTFILKTSFHESMNFLYENKYAFLVENYSEILSNLSSKTNQNSSSIKKLIWDNNPIKKFNTSITNIIKK